MKLSAMYDKLFLDIYLDDWFSWGESKIELLEDFCLATNKPEWFDKINDLLQEYWIEPAKDSFEFRDLLSKFEKEFKYLDTSVAWNRIPEDKVIRDKLLEVLDKFVIDNDLSYVDNIRFAKSTDEQSLKSYKEIQRKGCCGFVDEQIIINDELYLYGFNFGH